MNKVLAFDFGASSGRAMLGRLVDGKLQLEDIYRFGNDPVQFNGTLYWDAYRLLFEVKCGITAAKNAGGFDCIGVDTWGVDFALIDSYGNMLDCPVHYRDSRTNGMIEEVDRLMGDVPLYGITGLQPMAFNTIYQLYYLCRYRKDLLARADKVLFMPDLFMYYLTGNQYAEYTIASTSGLLDQHTGGWNYALMDKLGIPRSLMPDIIMPGSIYGRLREELCEELGVPSVPVIAVCTHDTASAVLAVPFGSKRGMFLSSGTWSLMGMELDEPDLSPRSQAEGFSNERGYGGTVRYLKNIMGLWIINECRRQWIREGMQLSYADIAREAEAAEPFGSMIDPDCQDFVAAGDMPARIRQYCLRTGQREPVTVGEIARCVYESLALKYRMTMDNMKQTGRPVEGLNIVGGGTNAEILCQFTADACNMSVPAGPGEGTAIGNVCVQLMSLKEIPDVAAARRLIAQSFEYKIYNPTNTDKWQRQYEKFCTIVSR